MTPKGCQFEGNAEKLTLRAESGDLTVLSGHIPYSAAVKAGAGKFTAEGVEQKFSCGEGLLSVTKEKVCLMIQNFENNQP